MVDNLHESRDEVVPDAGPKQHGDCIPRPLVRLIVGFLGSFFGFQVLWIAISSVTEPDGRRIACFPILLLPSMIVFGLTAGWAALTTITLVRTAAWAVAGFGAGFLLDGDARLFGCRRGFGAKFSRTRIGLHSHRVSGKPVT